MLFLLAVACRAQSPVFNLQGLLTEVGGTTNGSVVTPTLGPPGLLIEKGTGQASFSPLVATPPGTAGGVSFGPCCSYTNTSYYSWVGSGVGSLFSAVGGKISLATTSTHSWATRVPGYTYLFDVQDVQGVHQFGVFMSVSTPTATAAKRLSIAMWRPVGATPPGSTGATTYYYVPAGTEQALFDLGKPLNIDIAWSAGKITMALNGNVVITTTYLATSAFNWGTTSTFLVGAQSSSGIGVSSTDDQINNLVVSSSSATPPPANTVTCVGPYDSVAGAVTLNCPPTTGFPHTMKILINLPSTAAAASSVQWEADGTKFIAGVGTH